MKQENAKRLRSPHNTGKNELNPATWNSPAPCSCRLTFSSPPFFILPCLPLLKYGLLPLSERQ